MPIVLSEPSGESLRVAAIHAAVARQYAALAAAMPLDPESGLGGNLLFAGDVAHHGELLRAANIAGAASLSASGDPAAGRAAMRDGVIDFLVTSLDEALRILKNEVRKRLPVSVSVGQAPEEVARQMLARGVLPDLLSPALPSPALPSPDLKTDLSASAQGFLDQGALRIPEQDAEPYAFWSLGQESAAWMPKLDACVRASITPDPVRQRWLRFAPRYLGRTGQKLHGVPLARGEEARLRSELVALEAGRDSEQSLQIPEIAFGVL